jgi:TetR/AcrR family transcriptional regulator, repressor for neighboring sulfatase
MARERSTTTGAGREAAVEKLVDAASDLFARHGPDGVSLRQIAAAAGVNYGLIHQYIGTKDDLLHLVFRSVSEQAAARLSAAADLDAALDELIGTGRQPSRYVSMLAWAILQGRDATALLGRSPALTALLERIDASGDARPDRRERVAAAVALNLGWQLFGSFIRNGVGLDATADDALAEQRRRLIRSFLVDTPASAANPE